MALFQSWREPVHLATTLRSSQISFMAASSDGMWPRALMIFAQLHVQRLNRVCGVDDLAAIRREGVERNDLFPGPAP